MTSVSYEVRDNIAEILLDSPPVNALNEAMIDALLQGLRRAAEDDSVRAVILASAVPRRFCAGLQLDSLRDAPPSRGYALVEKLYSGLCEAQFHLGKPSIAAVGGTARGGGMTLAIHCDMIVAADTATFGYPEIDVGLVPAIHYTHLPRIIGRHRAFDLLFTGRSFDAAEAMSLGLVNRVVPEQRVMEEARALARSLCQKSPEIMRMGRQAFMRANDIDYRRGVAGAVETFGNIFATEDAQEGIAAFVERRKPRWQA
ncbi:enoyl-CoA hydratase/carnithine racemase [Cupriavidus metallidurans]|jgi:enoyl-CoA hydratase/carnithine racemase|uniref:Enoyl-CoA hydratase n=1 Tax=Cupriavidus metallidurans (strain ATCC 43123 / DSM 2839 / NBRC 102507 / CH34) TaxID=266264 RepID=Q1LHU1_CUPMC|nr:enoyl-CoA hydratase/isomerase family protein [Cupriavidus metallidurans]ABF10285.1 Enoyl-CoA hydratase [Cupriavidus metallidurans CH34]KWW33586.1 putative enoyl-CoA hydratase echA8 [Cupriavidus metallidurans]MDE4919741.1 enoyl-CoA hydratase/isomerase family protein [Cupriavidus metallidurans]QGS28941.1 enoyl-CoA hydratase/isomerase family protein [Cupriavidus metallidurans]UBM10818.1 enoyl-CoA hydratase/isomerase family protein [Cupriavidus metallidurans]